MAKRSAGADPSAILPVVIELLETRGMEGWQLREVADRLHMSLSTLYKMFPSRDGLILAAVELWMEQNVFQPIEPPASGKSVFEVLNAMFRMIFEPWEQHPQMLHIYIRTGEAGAGDRLLARGQAATRPLFTASRELNRALAADVEMILTNVTEGALARFSKGDIDVTDILPMLERTLARLEQAAHASGGQASLKVKRSPRVDGGTSPRRRAAKAN